MNANTGCQCSLYVLHSNPRYSQSTLLLYDATLKGGGMKAVEGIVSQAGSHARR